MARMTEFVRNRKHMQVLKELIELVSYRGSLTFTEYAQTKKISMTTAKEHFRQLIEGEIVTRKMQKQPRRHPVVVIKLKADAQHIERFFEKMSVKFDPRDDKPKASEFVTPRNSRVSFYDPFALPREFFAPARAEVQA